MGGLSYGGVGFPMVGWAFLWWGRLSYGGVGFPMVGWASSPPITHGDQNLLIIPVEWASSPLQPRIRKYDSAQDPIGQKFNN